MIHGNGSTKTFRSVNSPFPNDWEGVGGDDAVPCPVPFAWAFVAACSEDNTWQEGLWSDLVESDFVLCCQETSCKRWPQLSVQRSQTILFRSPLFMSVPSGCSQMSNDTIELCIISKHLVNLTLHQPVATAGVVLLLAVFSFFTQSRNKQQSLQ